MSKKTLMNRLVSKTGLLSVFVVIGLTSNMATAECLNYQAVGVTPANPNDEFVVSEDQQSVLHLETGLGQI